MAVPVPLAARAAAELERRRRRKALRHASDIAPGSDESFRAWCTRLSEAGLAVDGHPFRLDDRQALHAIYDLIPTYPEDAYDRVIALIKGAQMGLTVWEVLADLYMALKWEPVTIGMYVPDAKLAPYKSTHRFLRLVKSVPAIYRRMTIQVEADGGERKTGAGNVLTRTLGESIFLFLWTSGATMTESFPADVVSFDEVQNMTPGDISKVQERLSASRIRFTLLLSTPKWPDADIDFWYRRGTQHEFHTRCQACGTSSVLAAYLPERFEVVIRWDPEQKLHRYCCPACHAWINDTQIGDWIPKNPGARIESYWLSQVLSPTVSAEKLVQEWRLCATGEQRQNFYNRKLGRPYSDPSQIPVTRDHLEACATAGRLVGITWRSSGRQTYMGVDQMGGFNAVLIKERLPDGRQALIHAAALFGLDAFAQTAELMARFGVAVCVLEGLPNWNEAKRFANLPEHRGRVYVAHYGDQADTMVWGDQIARTDIKTDIDEQDRFTVLLNQYKAMQSSLARITNTQCLFPDPSGLEVDYRDGAPRRVALLRDIIFEHLTRVALISERDPETARWKTFVKKVGMDPHYAYANMLCDVAWSRAHGMTQFWSPAPPAEPTTTSPVEALTQAIDEARRIVVPGTCGSCTALHEGRCTRRGFGVKPSAPACEDYTPVS